MIDSQGRLERPLHTQSLRLLAGGCALACALAAVAIYIDTPITRMCLADRLPGDARLIFRLSEAVAHGYGAFAILLGLCLCQAISRRRFRICLLLVYTPAFFVLPLKHLVIRRRPNQLNIEDLPATGLASLEGLVPWGTADMWEWTHRGVQSFPSGHAATATALALVLAWNFPRGRWFFTVMAVLASAQRVDSGAHYLSDVLFGASLGFLNTAVWVAGAKLRHRWRTRRQPATAESETLELPRQQAA